MAAPHTRIVSLLPSATEIVFALGYGDRLVGRSHECDYPSEAGGLPACTSVKYDAEGTSYEIDQKLRAVIQEGLSVYRVDGDLLRALRPDVIVTQSQCEVCAVSLGDVEAAVCDWTDHGASIVSLEPNALADILADFERVAAAMGEPERGAAFRRDIEDRMSRLADGAAALSERPRVATIEWIDPLMAGGNWMPELVAMAGGEEVFGRAAEHSHWIEWDDLVAADPDVILVMPCGFDMAQSMAELPTLARRPEWPRLKAVREGRVAVADGHQYFNRPGPRIAESLEILAEILHPERFDFGHKGSAWRAV